MKFSICTPATMDKDHPDNLRMPRYEMFLRCANSVFGQTYQDFEWIIADDMSNPPIEEILEKHDSWWKPKGLQVKVVRLPEKSGRIVARNAAMKAATGEWITWLDSDDEYALNYLEAINDATKIYPGYWMFNFNHLIFSYDYHPYIRDFIDMEKQGLAPFRAGTIGAGAFVFKKEAFETVGTMPELGLWDFANHAFEEFPELKPFYEKQDAEGKPTGQYNSLGNPWGEDFYYFYKLTRKYGCKKLNAAFYYVHSRFGHRWPDDPDFVVDPGKKPSYDANNR